MKKNRCSMCNDSGYWCGQVWIGNCKCKIGQLQRRIDALEGEVFHLLQQPKPGKPYSRMQSIADMPIGDMQKLRYHVLSSYDSEIPDDATNLTDLIIESSEYSSKMIREYTVLTDELKKRIQEINSEDIE